MVEMPDTAIIRGQVAASRTLVLMMGWEYRHDGVTGDWFSADGTRKYEEWQRRAGYSDRYDAIYLNLYDLRNASLAWMVLNWANQQYFGSGIPLDQWPWWHNFCADLRLLPLKQVIKKFLDEILRLAIESGIAKDGGM